MTWTNIARVADQPLTRSVPYLAVSRMIAVQNGWPSYFVRVVSSCFLRPLPSSLTSSFCLVKHYSFHMTSLLCRFFDLGLVIVRFCSDQK